MQLGKHGCPFMAARAVCLLAPLLPPNLNFPHALYKVCLFFSFEDGKLIFSIGPYRHPGWGSQGRKKSESVWVGNGRTAVGGRQAYLKEKTIVGIRESMWRLAFWADLKYQVTCKEESSSVFRGTPRDIQEEAKQTRATASHWALG